MFSLLLLILLCLSCLGPGFFFVRRIRGLTGSERLCGSIALSLVLLYLAAGLIYLTGISWRFCWLITFIAAVLAALSGKSLAQFVAHRNIRNQLLAFAILIAIGLLALSLIQSYSGAQWAADWNEHYQRTIFFLEGAPYDTRFVQGIYALPARPPMMHLIGAHFLAHHQIVEAPFEYFQIISLFLNALAFFPCVLIAGMLVRGGGRRVWLIAVFLALNPLFIQNSTWVWNKLFAGFFVILSIALYLRGWRKQSPWRIIAAAGAMAAGLLVHYSAGPYALFLLLHYLCIGFWRRTRLVEVLGSIGIVIGLLATWFVWTTVIYGPAGAFASNMTATSMQNFGAIKYIEKAVSNLITSIIPFPLVVPRREFFNYFYQPNRFGYVRDYYFLLSQQNLLGAFGPLGWAVVIYLAIRSLRRAADSALRKTWIAFVLFVVFLGIVVVGPYDPFGVAHAGLQPLILIGITLLAASFPSLQPWMRAALGLSMAIHAALGIILHLRIEMLAIHCVRVGNADVIRICQGLTNIQAATSSLVRFNFKFEFFSDHFTGSIVNGLLLTATVGAFAALLVFVGAAPLSRSNRGMRVLCGSCVAGLFVAASVLCLADRALGYVVVTDLPFPLTQDQAVVRQILAPFEEAVRANHESADAHYRLAEAHYYFDHESEAWHELLEAALLDPDHRPTHYLVGIFFFAYHATTPENVIVASLYYGTYRDTAQNYINYGVALFSSGYLERGFKVLSEASRRWPTDPRAHDNLAMALFRLGKPNESVEEFKTALRYAPDNPEIAEHLRKILTIQGVDPQTIEQTVNQIRAGANSPR